MKFCGVISLRKDLPIWAIPNGGLRRIVRTTLAKFVNIPWAVSGRRYATAPSSSMGPAWVLNMRLNARASVRSDEPQLGQTPSILSARHRSLQFRQSTIGSVKFVRCPDACQIAGGERIAASSPTTSSRYCTLARHHASFTLRSSRTPRGP